MRNNHSLTHIRSIYTVAYPEFQRGGCLRSGILGGGGGGLLVRYKKCVCMCVCGEDAVRFKSDTKTLKWGLWHRANTLSLITNGYYNFGRGGCSSTRSTLSRGGYRIFLKGDLDPRYSTVA